jgi:hypothetical protein
VGHEFEQTHWIDVDAAPDQVWAAIATGPGTDAWYLGRNEIGTGEGASAASDFADGAIPAQTVARWEPGQRLSLTGPTAPDGRFLAVDYLIEGARGGATTLKIVSSGFLPGDDWEAEFEAMQAGNCVFRASLQCYLDHFAGRTAVPVTVFGPRVADWTEAWARFDAAVGLASLDRGARATVGGVDCELYVANDQARGFRSPDAMFRFLQGFAGPMVVAHCLFAPVDTGAEAARWQDWLTNLFTL